MPRPLLHQVAPCFHAQAQYGLHLQFVINFDVMGYKRFVFERFAASTTFQSMHQIQGLAGTIVTYPVHPERVMDARRSSKYCADTTTDVYDNIIYMKMMM